MFDYIYSNIHGISTVEILKNPNLEFTTILNLTTGEIGANNVERKHGGTRKPKNIKRAILHGLTLKVTNDTHINLEGSLHEFTHGNNYCQFRVEELRDAIKRIENILNVTGNDIKLHNLEFGVNIQLPFPVNLFLDSLLSYKGREPDRLTYNGKGNMRKFTFTQYEVKFYDKGLQYNLPGNLLRVEVKVRRMIFIQRKTGIKTLSCLLRREVYPYLKEILLEPIRAVITTENGIDTKLLAKKDAKLYKEGRQKNYWSSLHEKNRRQYWKRAEAYRKLIDNIGPNKIRRTVEDAISKTWDELTTPGDNLTDQDRTDLTDQDSVDCVRINPYTNLLNSTQVQERLEIGRRFCKSCGRDISDQKPGSVFCSEMKYGATGKRCRNIDSNPRNNFLRREKRIQERGLLFDIQPFLSLKLQ